ncbi:MAG: ABC transporter permease [Microbacterium sp.]|nr:ABC transporter permease [Microbacterium sp.]
MTAPAPGATHPAAHAIPADRLRAGAGFGGSVGLVAEREIRMRLRSRVFIVSMAIILFLIVVGTFGSSLFTSAAGGDAGGGEGHPVAVVGTPELPDEGLDPTPVADRAEGEALLREGDVDAVIVPSDGARGLSVIGLDEAPAGVISALTISPDVELIAPSDVNPALGYLAAFGFGIVFFMAGTLFGTQIAQSVIEEKQTRVVEILLSSVSVRALLAGKVLGNSALAIGQIVLFASVGGIALALTGRAGIIAAFGPAVLWFVLFFAFGFVLLASLYSATAALVSRHEDLNATTMPVSMLVMIPYFLIVFAYESDAIVAVMSYVPFSAPVGMPVRIFLGQAQWWEPFAALAVLLATMAGVVALAARMYENSLLRTGARVSWGEALRRSSAGA